MELDGEKGNLYHEPSHEGKDWNGYICPPFWLSALKAWEELPILLPLTRLLPQELLELPLFSRIFSLETNTTGFQNQLQRHEITNFLASGRKRDGWTKINYSNRKDSSFRNICFGDFTIYYPILTSKEQMMWKTQST